MPAKWLRKEKARECPIHRAICDEAQNLLASRGDFKKDDVLDSLNFQAVADSIRWDYVREFLQEKHDCELVPMASAYFNRHRKDDEEVNPGKYLASGFGKKTAGFCSVEQHNGHLARARITLRRARVAGAYAACERDADAIEGRLSRKALEEPPRRSRRALPAPDVAS